MVAGPIGEDGVTVPSTVEVDPGHGQGHVTILHRNMVAMAVKEMLRKIAIVTPTLVQVSNNKQGIFNFITVALLNSVEDNCTLFVE